MAEMGMALDPLTAFLVDSEKRLVGEITRRLRESDSAHYRQMETIDLEPRIQVLYEAFRDAVLAGEPEAVNSFVDDIGRKRLLQHYELEELLLVFDTLAAVVWEAAAASFRNRGAGAFDDLWRLSTGVSWAKGRLVTVYAAYVRGERDALTRLNAAFQEYLTQGRPTKQQPHGRERPL